MSYGLLEHFENEGIHDLLAESIRVLKPGGYFIALMSFSGIKIINVRTNWCNLGAIFGSIIATIF